MHSHAHVTTLARERVCSLSPCRPTVDQEKKNTVLFLQLFQIYLAAEPKAVALCQTSHGF